MRNRELYPCSINEILNADELPTSAAIALQQSLQHNGQMPLRVYVPNRTDSLDYSAVARELGVVLLGPERTEPRTFIVPHLIYGENVVAARGLALYVQGPTTDGTIG